MGNKLFTLALMATIGPALATDMGISVNINEPGLYGRIDLGNVTPPPVVYARPVIIQPALVGVASPPPIYLHVPSGHEKHWEKHCHEYNSCERPVYFVKEDWYANEYAPRHRNEDRREEHLDHNDRDERKHRDHEKRFDD